MINIFRKSILLNDSLRTQFSKNIVISIVTYEPIIKDNRFLLKIDFNYKNNPAVLHRLNLEYLTEKDALIDKKECLIFKKTSLK